MKQFLLFISVLFLPLTMLGQGAATPKDAWNGGVPNQYWFMLDQDIKDATSWEYRSDYYTPPGGAYNILTDPRKVGFNEIFLAPPINALNNSNSRTAYDASIFWFTSVCSFDREEWYIIKAPSTGTIEVSLDLTGNYNIDNNSTQDKTLIIYEFDEIEINDALDDLGIIPSCASSSYGSFFLQELYNSSPNPVLSIVNNSISKEYILLRIGNNQTLFSYPYITSYELNISTNNKDCNRALKTPVSLDAFSSSTDKILLNSSSELSSAYYTARSGNVSTGNNDLNIPTNTGTKGMWFHVENITDDPVYAALCNVSQNAQMVIYKDNSSCPTLVDANDDIDHIVGAEDQNTDDNGNGGVDICLIGTNSTNNPVMRMDAPASSYYIYLFGGHGGADFDFDFYFLNSSGTELGGGGILPVEWILFNGKAEGSYNRLEWVTGSEQQNDYFSVEKSRDGENFTELAKVEGAGNSAFENIYSTIDPFSYPLTYYRISQVDWDGTVHNGPQTVVENHNAITNFQVLTNPVETNSIVCSYYITKDENIQIELYSLNGVNVYSKKNFLSKDKSELNIPITNLKSGMYLLSIKTAYTNYTQKIIISINQ